MLLLKALGVIDPREARRTLGVAKSTTLGASAAVHETPADWVVYTDAGQAGQMAFYGMILRSRLSLSSKTFILYDTSNTRRTQAIRDTLRPLVNGGMCVLIEDTWIDDPVATVPEV